MSSVTVQSERNERFRAPSIPDEIWDKHKETLRDLILEKKWAWKDIISHMQEDEDFHATFVQFQIPKPKESTLIEDFYSRESQYHIKCREWQFYKNKQRKRGAEPG